jgi:hypothetical protein
MTGWPVSPAISGQACPGPSLKPPPKINNTHLPLSGSRIRVLPHLFGPLRRAAKRGLLGSSGAEKA